MFVPLLESKLPLESFLPFARDSSHFASLLAAVPELSELRPCLVPSESDSARRERRREFFEGT